MPSTDPSTPRNDGDLYHEEDANGNIKETMTYTKGDPAPASDVPAQRVVVKALALVGLAFLGIILLPLLVALAGLLLGLALGLAAYLAAGRVLAHLVVDLATTDPATLLAVPCLLALVGFLACLLPALRAARVDPAIALRND